MALHPEIEATCLEEIQSVFGNKSDDMIIEEFQDVNQLHYTRAVILETLRLYPPAPMTTRTSEKSMELHGHVFAKGTAMFVPIWSIQRDARNFPRPTKVRPDRWVRRCDSGSGWEERPQDDDNNDTSNSNSVPPANTDAFCVFAAGARNCVGRKLAMQEAVTLLALLLRKLQFQLIDETYRVQPTLTSVVQQPAEGLPMIITPRKY